MGGFRTRANRDQEERVRKLEAENRVLRAALGKIAELKLLIEGPGAYAGVAISAKHIARCALASPQPGGE